MHCAVTAHLLDNDQRKSSMRMPLTIADRICRLWGTDGGNVPSSRRIMENCDRALCAFGIFYENGGKMVPGLANRNGHRNHAQGRNRAEWGGLRIKNVLVEEVDWWLHPGAVHIEDKRTLEIISNPEHDANSLDDED